MYKDLDVSQAETKHGVESGQHITLDTVSTSRPKSEQFAEFPSRKVKTLTSSPYLKKIY